MRYEPFNGISDHLSCSNCNEISFIFFKLHHFTFPRTLTSIDTNSSLRHWSTKLQGHKQELWLLKVNYIHGRHTAHWNFNPTIPVDVIKANSFVYMLFNPTCVPMQVSINELTFVPERMVAGRITLLWNSGWFYLSLTTYFQYDGSIYEQQERASMGNQVSAVKASLYVEDLRNKLWHPRLAHLRSGNAMWMTPLVSHCFEQLFVFFFENGY